MADQSFKAIPTFRITNYALAIKFYVDYLGFMVDWEHRFNAGDPIYMQISKDDLVLHLSENERFSVGVIVFIETIGIVKLRDDLLQVEGMNTVPEITLTNWNTKQLEILDPFDNLLRFNEN